MTAEAFELRGVPLPIVLLPGLDGTGDLFAPLVDSAPPGLDPQVLELADLPGRSYTEYADFLEPRLATSEPFVLLGESFSGPLAVLLAARRPPGLRALILCNSFVVPPSWSALRWLPWRGLLSIPAPGWALRRWMAGRDSSPDLVEAIRRCNRKVGADVRTARLRAALSVDVRRELASVACPILYLRGTRDRLVRSASVDAIEGLRPDVQVRELNAPHLLLQTRPADCWQAIRDFVTKVD